VRLHAASRDSGAVAVWCRKALLVPFLVHVTSRTKKFVCIKVQNIGSFADDDDEINRQSSADPLEQGLYSNPASGCDLLNFSFPSSIRLMRCLRTLDLQFPRLCNAGKFCE